MIAAAMIGAAVRYWDAGYGDLRSSISLGIHLSRYFRIASTSRHLRAIIRDFLSERRVVKIFPARKGRGGDPACFRRKYIHPELPSVPVVPVE